jgi:hypothetical protein
MIVNLYVAVDLAIALFALVVGCFAALKAYKVDEGIKKASTDQRYELEKDFYLVSTVGWMTLGTRILAVPLFWITVISLISSVPGAMCEFGVFQAGAPWSWVDLGFKLFTMFAFGGWLFYDIMNRKLKGSTMMSQLSRGFVMLLPLLFIDALLDIAFFGGLKPLVVPCCMVVYSSTAPGLFNIGCPFCFVTYQYPLLWGVIATYSLAIALLLWSFLFGRSAKKIQGAGKEVAPLMQKVPLAILVLGVIGTVLLVSQIILGAFGSA